MRSSFISLLILMGFALTFGADNAQAAFPYFVKDQSNDVFFIFPSVTTYPDLVEIPPSARLYFQNGESLDKEVPVPDLSKMVRALDTEGEKTAHFLDEELKPWVEMARFPDGLVYSISSLNRSLKSLRNIDGLIRFNLGHLDALDEKGQLLSIYGETENGDPIVERPDGNFYLRHMEGLKILENLEDQRLRVMELAAPIYTQPIFENIRQGLQLDLDDPLQRRIFKMYIASEFAAENRIEALESKIDEMNEFINANHIPEKPKLPFAQIEVPGSEGLNLRLRPLRLRESVFRGYIGCDCSTVTRFLRSLEPAHLHFAIEAMPFRPLGQIEVVLGSSPETGKTLAFWERIQSPRNIRPKQLVALIRALKEILQTLDVELIMPKDLKAYSSLGHPITNFTSLYERLNKVLTEDFHFTDSYAQFQRKPDLYMTGRELMDPINLTANRLISKGVTAYGIERTPPPDLEKDAKISLIYPPVEKKADLHELRRISEETHRKFRQIRSTSSYMQDGSPILPAVWEELEKMFWPDCEDALDQVAHAS